MSERCRFQKIPQWLHFVLISDRAGSAAYIGAGFFFAPVLAVLSPWPALTAACWVIIGLAGLWLGLLGIAMAAGLAMVLRTRRRDTRGLLAVDHRLSDYCATACFDAP